MTEPCGLNTQLTAKQGHDPYFVDTKRVPTASLTLACICTATLTVAWTWGMHRIAAARKSRKPWCGTQPADFPD